MTRTTSWIFAVTLGCAALSGCGAGQAPSDYRGEPLMSLKGSVTSSESVLGEDLVPALVFGPPPFVTNYEENTVHYLRGEVEGQFPSSFTLSLYEPPPASVLGTFAPGEPAYADGNLTAVHAEHPAWLRTRYISEEVPGGSVQKNEVCSPTECISAYPSECPLGEQDPDAYWPCTSRFPEALHWSEHGYSENHGIVYFAADVAAGGLLSYLYGGDQAIAAGYHIVERDPRPYETDRDCYERTSELVLAEWNRRTGRDSDVNIINSDEENREHSLLFASTLKEQGCKPPLRILQPDTARIELTFADDRPVSIVGF